MVLSGCLALAGCGGSNGADAGTTLAPYVTSVSPNNVAAGAGDTPVTIAGGNFVSTSVVYWNSAPLTTTFISSQSLTATVPASYLTAPGQASVSVLSPGAGPSSAVEFTVTSTSQANPVPTLTSVSPSSLPAASDGGELVLTGANFLPETVVVFNNFELTSTLVSRAEMQAQVPSFLLTSAGTVAIYVFNPSPGGGSSKELDFTITEQPSYPNTEIAQASNDLVWNPSAGVIYLSVPSTAAAYGNTVAVLDPDAGMVIGSQFAGSEPSRLALSEDGQFLYVGLDGAASVKRLTLPSLATSEEFSLGVGSYSGAYVAVDLQVAPGLPHTAAVLLGNSDEAAIAVFDDGVARGMEAQNLFYDTLTWGADATHLYANNNQNSLFDLYTLSVDAGGVTQVGDVSNAFPGYYNRIHFDPGTGYLYGDDGDVVDPSTGLPAGIFQAYASAQAGLMVPDSKNGRAFFLTYDYGSQGVTLQVFDLTHFTSITSLSLPHVQGSPLRLIRWGTRGLAFNTAAGFVYVVSGGFVDGSN